MDEDFVLICSICMDNVNNVLELGCSHKFCEECIDEWKQRNSNCPLCRKEFPYDGNNWENWAVNAAERIRDIPYRNVQIEEMKKLVETCLRNNKKYGNCNVLGKRFFSTVFRELELHQKFMNINWTLTDWILWAITFGFVHPASDSWYDTYLPELKKMSIN